MARKKVKAPRVKSPTVDKSHHRGVEGWLAERRWVRVSSSNVEKIQYDARNHVLRVKFLGSPIIYAYKDVLPGVARSMFNAPSQGKFVWRYLRDVYDFDKE